VVWEDGGGDSASYPIAWHPQQSAGSSSGILAKT